MYNAYHSDLTCKREADTVLLLVSAEQRKVLREYIARFTFKRLLECKNFFRTYVEKHGTQTPLQTSYVSINKVIDCSLFYTYYLHGIPTNQKYVGKFLQLIEDAQKNTQEEKEVVVVFKTLKQIYEIYQAMITQNIKGTTKQNFEKMLIAFNLPLEKEKFKEESELISARLELLPKARLQERLYSPTYLK